MQTESQDTCSITKEKMPYRANLRISGYTELEIPESFDINVKGNIICLIPKTLEKLIEPKFKVGDRIRHKTTNKNDIYEISNVYNDSYGLVGFTWMIYMKYQDQYELVPNKFDITTLKPFESKVLVRDYNNHMWEPVFWGKLLDTKNPNLRYLTTNGCFKYCIPYEGNEHLLGKTDDCDEYYKTWK